MIRAFRFLVRISAFVGKEMLEILRQPRLVLLLVLGPFTVLALFGVGYVGAASEFRTLFVVEKWSALAAQIPEYGPNLSPQLIYYGVTGDRQQALDKLRNRELDLVIVAPEDAEETIRSNQQATFMLYHNEIDPVQANYIRYFGNTIVEGVNRIVLQTAAEEGQQESGDVQRDVQSARQSASAMRQAVLAGDAAAAQENLRNLSGSLDKLALALAANSSALGTGAADDGQAKALREAVAALREETRALADTPADRAGSNQHVQRLTKMEEGLGAVETQLAAFRSVSPNVLVSPFAAETRTVAQVQPTMVAFYVPAVLALLLQHLAVTLAGLSIVREQQFGAMELFRVSPVSAAEMLVGKYISYMIFQALLTAALTALVLFGLDMVMLGDWLDFVAVVAAVSFASLGYGFVISLFSQSDSQAVQLTMLVLLVSVFFSGFFMSLKMLAPWLQGLSWALPVTYGIAMLRNIMLRGIIGPPVELGALLGIGVALALLAWLMLKRRMKRA
jgi:ABC-2 type transport system permease protein